MTMKDQINEPMGRALCARLRNEGKQIVSTVAPKEWTPIDPALVEAAQQEAKWIKR